jgi:hypothetical protein
MDIVKALRDLYNEKKRLDVAIATLEARVKAARTGSVTAKAARSRRGRKSMSAAERLEVSRRMTLYWEARRAKASPSEEPPQSHAENPARNEGQQASTTSA